MNIYEGAETNDIAEMITHVIERDVQKKIFTLRIVGEDSEGLNTIIIFKDRSVLQGKITIDEIMGKMACRLQGDWI